jgi:L-lysine 2,3-aminomutase
LDRVSGAAHFEVDESTGRRLIAEIRARLPGYLVPRLVREAAGGLSKTPVA